MVTLGIATDVRVIGKRTSHRGSNNSLFDIVGRLLMAGDNISRNVTMAIIKWKKMTESIV